VRAEIRALNPRLPVYDVTTLSDRRSLALRRDRMMAALSGGLGAVALLLTAVGVYGVIAYSVGRRTAEIGIRMALGATGSSVRWLIVRETLRLLGGGGAIGIPLSLAGARVLKSTLFGVAPQDPVTLAASVSVLILAGCVAGYLPARRAARLEPAIALRRD
jgi:ABC-type antimicrobial peptide transport system permease subunit